MSRAAQRRLEPRKHPATPGRVPDREEVRPFLKWAGGKGQLLEQFRPHLPPRFSGYVEPFVGSGAVFFRFAGRSRPKRRILADGNGELIFCYEAVRNDVEGVIRALRKHERLHGPRHYYAVRKVRPESLPAAERAARLIYLNRTCYNGLYRVNSRGQFNVPMGRYANPRICDAENLRRASRALRGVALIRDRFENAPAYCRRDDFVYLDPPYHPISATSFFTAYTPGTFSAEDQERLAEVCDELDRIGCLLMLSNSDCSFIRRLYRGRYRIHTVLARRAINSRGDRRGPLRELLIRNY